jgi:hypothetical protein
MVHRLRASQYQVIAYDHTADALERLDGDAWLIAHANHQSANTKARRSRPSPRIL